MKILNLYAGIGGNRALWGAEHQVTAVEIDSELAAIYQEFFPNDKVVVGDAHKYLLEHYKEFDFIWSSPPCQSHSDIRRMATDRGVCKPKYPDMKLYEEILFLKQYAKGKWVVENVVPYYKPLLPAQVRARHCFWANFPIPDFRGKHDVVIKNVTSHSTVFGFSLKNRSIKMRKDQVLRNCVNPELGLHVLNSASKTVQVTLN